jgi:hypothetical protein
MKPSGGGGASSTDLTKTVGEPQSPEQPHQYMQQRRRETGNRLPTMPRKKETTNIPTLEQVRKRKVGPTCMYLIGDK